MKTLLKKILSPKLRRKVLNFLNRLWCAVCKCLPLQNRVLFYTIRADGKLADNSKAVYDALDTKKIIFAHMLPHSIKIKPLAYYYLLTSKVIVTDDYVRYMRAVKLRPEQKLIQIWHACGAFKKFGLDAPSQITREEEIATHSQYTAVAVTSENCRKFYAGAFGVSKDICLPLGLPRTDALIGGIDAMREKTLSAHPEFSGKKIYLYCPTFREEDGKQVEFDPKIDWDDLSKNLADDELFIIRRHPIMKYSLINKEYRNIIDLSSESTLMLTAASSAIITDYSSVIYDACLMDVPCVFYCPDIEKYERGFYLDFPDGLPGEMTTQAASLLETIRKSVTSPDKEKTAKFKADQLSACDGHSAERIAKLIKEWL